MNQKSGPLLIAAALLLSLSNVDAKKHKMDAGLYGSFMINIPEAASVKKITTSDNILDYHFADENSAFLTSFIFQDADKFNNNTLKVKTLNAGIRLLGTAEERHIDVIPLPLKQGMAYYFSVTDKAPKPGEFKYMTQGYARFDEVVVSFSILHNDESMKQNTAWLTSLASLKYE